MQAAFAVEARTNDRIREEVGELSRVLREDYVLGPGSTPVMAAFTHVGRPSRFTNGSFGIYYAGESVNTAIAEARFHRERFLKATDEPAKSLTMRAYVGTLHRPLHNIRGKGYRKYQNPDVATYPRCQQFSVKVRAAASWGLIYRSVRRSGGECIAVYRPPAVGTLKQSNHYVLYWNGEQIAHTYEVKEISQPWG